MFDRTSLPGYMPRDMIHSLSSSLAGKRWDLAWAPFRGLYHQKKQVSLVPPDWCPVAPRVDGKYPGSWHLHRQVLPVLLWEGQGLRLSGAQHHPPKGAEGDCPVCPAGQPLHQTTLRDQHRATLLLMLYNNKTKTINMLLGESIQNIPEGRGGCNGHSDLETVHFIHCLPSQPFCTTDLHHQRSPSTATSTARRLWEGLLPATHRVEED